VYGNVRQNMGILILVKYYFTSGSNNSLTSAYLTKSSNSNPSTTKHHIWLTHGVKDTILYHIVKGSLAGIRLEREVIFSPWVR
jgi:hypothetical protein